MRFSVGSRPHWSSHKMAANANVSAQCIFLTLILIISQRHTWSFIGALLHKAFRSTDPGPVVELTIYKGAKEEKQYKISQTNLKLGVSMFFSLLRGLL